MVGAGQASKPQPLDGLQVRCCIAGGGPAGVMLGLLLARAGVTVAVLEKHADFLRDFRGDTIHPSTLEVMHELGLGEALLTRPHQKAATLAVEIGQERLTVADFSHLPVRSPFVAFMPQWDFLDFLAGEARRYPGFHLAMRAEVVDLVERNGVIAGVRVATPAGPAEVGADLVVGCDGRHSTVRERAGLRVEEIGAPMDVLWFSLSRGDGDPDESFGHVEPGRLLVLINRGTYWQCGLIIAKGTMAMVQARGLDRFRADLAASAPFLADRVHEIGSFADVKLLTVAVDRLAEWARPGLLCLGDAAHAMSPIGGVGINLAIQDAVAAANLLAGPLRAGPVGLDALRAVQRRRAWPTRATQALQVAAQNRVIARVLAGRPAPGGPVSVPWPLRLLARFPRLRRWPARLIGLGLRPEHVETPARPLPA